MREISTEKIEIGEHVLIDGVEYVAEKAGLCNPCERCAFDEGSELCSNFIECDGIIFKKVEKESKYRPYQDTEEMVADWKKRFNKIIATYSMPLIWVRSKATGLERLITSYGTYFVSCVGAKTGVRDLFDNYTYLDGSPCGKEVTQ